MEKVRIARRDEKFAIYELRANGKWVLTRIANCYHDI